MSSEMEPPRPPISNMKAMEILGDSIYKQWNRESYQVKLFNEEYEEFNFRPSLERYNRLRESYKDILNRDLTPDINDKLITAYEKTKEIIEIIRAQKRKDNSLSTTRGGSRRRRNTTSRSKKSKKSTRKSSRRHNKKSNRRYRKYRR
jgi:hypothetical protein